MSKSKKVKAKESKEYMKKERAKLLLKVGYTSAKAKHGKSARPDFPDLSTPKSVPLSNKVANGFVPRTGASHPDAMQFPVGNSHKQGLELIYSPAYAAQMNGKKT